MNERKIRGLAWDDKVEYMVNLSESLSHLKIDLEIEDNVRDFESAFVKTLPDFVVLDLFDSNGQKAGLDLAKWVAERQQHWYPVFVITKDPQVVEPEDYERLPLRAVFSYKVKPPWMALRIQEELIRQGVLVEFNKVFLIYAYERQKQYQEPIANWMKAYGLSPEKLRPGNLREEIGRGLLNSINSCSAVVAICTPDEVGPNGRGMPRQNVLVEIGMTLGLPRGLERLILLRHEEAHLPSDIESIGRIDFKGDVNETFEQLGEALRQRGIPFPV